MALRAKCRDSSTKQAAPLSKWCRLQPGAIMYVFRDNLSGELQCSDEYPNEDEVFHIESFNDDMEDRDVDELYIAYEAEERHCWLETKF